MDRSMEGRTAWSAVSWTLALALLSGCASGKDPGDEEIDALVPDKVCVRDATVTVRVWNQGSMAVRLAFGSYAPARIAEAFERTNYSVARPHLQHSVRIEVARGGLQVGPPASIQTEAVVCNIATLVIGASPRYSVFYGDVIYGPSDLRAAQEETAREEEEEHPEEGSAEEESGDDGSDAEAPADTTSSSAPLAG